MVTMSVQVPLIARHDALQLAGFRSMANWNIVGRRQPLPDNSFPLPSTPQLMPGRTFARMIRILPSWESWSVPDMTRRSGGCCYCLKKSQSQTGTVGNVPLLQTSPPDPSAHFHHFSAISLFRKATLSETGSCSATRRLISASRYDYWLQSFL